MESQRGADTAYTRATEDCPLIRAPRLLCVAFAVVASVLAFALALALVLPGLRQVKLPQDKALQRLSARRLPQLSVRAPLDLSVRLPPRLSMRAPLRRCLTN